MSTHVNALIETEARAGVSGSGGVEFSRYLGLVIWYNGIDVNFEVNIRLGEPFHY